MLRSIVPHSGVQCEIVATTNHVQRVDLNEIRLVQSFTSTGTSREPASRPESLTAEDEPPSGLYRDRERGQLSSPIPLSIP